MSEQTHEVLIFAGPHGAGKDTLEHSFTSGRDDATRHVRYSSRSQAPGEVQGLTYHFVTPEEFEEMVKAGAFLDFNHYPEGSSGIAIANLLQDVEKFRFTSITTNFEEALSLVKKLGALQIQNRCLFIGPCAEGVMLAEPTKYLGTLATRMALRARASDDIDLRLRKAALYRELYIRNQNDVIYIANEDDNQAAAIAQIKSALKP